MEVGIDDTGWWNRRGCGRFTCELLKALIAESARLFVDPAPEPATRARRACEARRRAGEYSWAKAARLTPASLKRCAGRR